MALILFIDDDPVDLLAIERSMKESQPEHAYITVSSAPEAWDALARMPIDLIVTDYRLDESTAFDFLERITDIPIIVVTGAGDQAIAVQAMKRGAYDYLVKDFDHRHLQTLPLVIANALARKKTETELQTYRNNLERLVTERTMALNNEIMARKKALEALQYNEALAQALLNASTESMILIDEAGTILAINEIGARRIGFSREHLSGKCLYDFFPSAVSESRRKKIDAVRASGVPIRFEDTRNEYFFDINMLPIFDANGTVRQIAIFARDISPIVKLQKEIITISEQERQLIGQDLHDDLGQHLTGIKYLITGLKQKMRDQSLPEADQLDEIAGHFSEAIERLRRIVRGLYPVSLNECGLIDALREMCREVSAIFNISCRIDADPSIDFDQNKSIHLYYIAQESINNAIKHGNAKNIMVLVERDEAWLRFCITNDFGYRLENKKKVRGIGIEIMRYRANLVGGELEIRDDRDSFSIEVRIGMPAS